MRRVRFTRNPRMFCLKQEEYKDLISRYDFTKEDLVDWCSRLLATIELGHCFARLQKRLQFEQTRNEYIVKNLRMYEYIRDVKKRRKALV